MKLPSIEHLIAHGRAAARRFPLALAAALVSAAAAFAGIDGGDEEPWVRLLATASLGLPLFIAITLLAERRGWSAVRAWAVRGLGLAVLAAFFWRWPAWSSDVRALRYFHLSAGLHLSVAVIAYLGVEEPRGFWQFNRALFLRFLLGAVYAVVLFAGLAVALAGIDNLLGVSVPGETYMRLWVLIAFVCHPWFFLAGIPDDFEGLDRRTDYPAGLRAFAQYVLLPLVTVYLVILTAYLVRVVVTRVWPSGWIGYLVSALATLGILSLLLIHPERERPDARWMDRYARVFWIAILPSTAMLQLAVWKRIAQYGVTERRYLLTVLAVWLVLIAIGYAVTRSRNIKWIPTSLAAVAFLTFLGPWSAYAISRRSQTGRLERLLAANGMLRDGRAVAAATRPTDDDRREITGSLEYLIRVHGTGSIDPWFDGGVASIDTIADGTGPSPRYVAAQRAGLIMGHLGVRPLEPGAGSSEYEHFAAAVAERARDIGGFEWALTGVDLRNSSHTVAGDEVIVTIGRESHILRIRRAGHAALVAPLDSLLARARRTRFPAGEGDPWIPPDSLRLDIEGPEAGARVYIEQLMLRTVDGIEQIESARGDVYLRWRDSVPP